MKHYLNLDNFKIKKFQRFALDVIESLSEIYPDFTDDSGTDNQKLLKANMQELSCRMQDVNSLNKATEKFSTINQAYFIEPNTIDNRYIN